MSDLVKEMRRAFDAANAQWSAAIAYYQITASFLAKFKQITEAEAEAWLKKNGKELGDGWYAVSIKHDPLYITDLPVTSNKSKTKGKQP